jgi:hypothetical protein
MSMKRKPCAYCGTNDVQRTIGHVIPHNLYPDSTDTKIQRRTVPECLNCKKVWEDAETQFRNVVLMAAGETELVLEKWNGPVARSLREHASGWRWANDMVRQLVPVTTVGGPRHAIYPDRDSDVMLIVRRIIRGLCAYHKLGTAIADNRVFARTMVFEVPPAFQSDLRWFSLGDRFCRYAYADFGAVDTEFHSAWLICFYDRVLFVGLVTTSPEGWPPETDPCHTADAASGDGT